MPNPHLQIPVSLCFPNWKFDLQLHYRWGVIQREPTCDIIVFESSHHGCVVTHIYVCVCLGKTYAFLHLCCLKFLFIFIISHFSSPKSLCFLILLLAHRKVVDGNSGFRQDLIFKNGNSRKYYNLRINKLISCDATYNYRCVE